MLAISFSTPSDRYWGGASFQMKMVTLPSATLQCSTAEDVEEVGRGVATSSTDHKFVVLQNSNLGNCSLSL